jgi:AcrR family transcriptional regulator
MSRTISDDDARERIVGTGSRIFFSRGFAKISMDDLARELRMSKKTIYRHFSTKEELVREVYRAKTARIYELFQETVAAKTDFTEKLYRICISVGKELSEMGQPYLEDLNVFTPGLARELEAFRRDEIYRNFLMLFEDGVRLGALRRDVNKDVLVQIYISAIMGVINPRVLVNSSFTIDEAFRTILDVMFDGILTDATRSHYRKKFCSSVKR